MFTANSRKGLLRQILRVVLESCVPILCQKRRRRRKKHISMTAHPSQQNCQMFLAWSCKASPSQLWGTQPRLRCCAGWWSGQSSNQGPLREQCRLAPYILTWATLGLQFQQRAENWWCQAWGEEGGHEGGKHPAVDQPVYKHQPCRGEIAGKAFVMADPLHVGHTSMRGCWVLEQDPRDCKPFWGDSIADWEPILCWGLL